MKTRKHKTPTDTRCRAVKGWTWVECEHGGQALRPLRCRRCVGCARHRQRQLTARIVTGLNGLPEGARVLFLTLTSVGRPGWAWLMKRWTRLVAKLRRRWGVRGYVCKKEQGKRRGMRHLHVLLESPSGRIPHSYICSEWMRMTGAYITWLRECPVDGGGQVLGRYLAKYLGKGDDARIWRKEVTYSAGWPKAAGPRFLKLDWMMADGGMTPGRGEISGRAVHRVLGWPYAVGWTAGGLQLVLPCLDPARCFGETLAVEWPL